MERALTSGGGGINDGIPLIITFHIFNAYTHWPDIFMKVKREFENPDLHHDMLVIVVFNIFTLDPTYPDIIIEIRKEFENPEMYRDTMIFNVSVHGEKNAMSCYYRCICDFSKCDKRFAESGENTIKLQALYIVNYVTRKNMNVHK